MSYEIVLSSSFKSSIKQLKRFRHVKDDVKAAIRVLLQQPRLGNVIPGGSGIRKLRVLNSDIGKGKSSGYRLLYYINEEPIPIIYLLLLYFKSDKEDVTNQELRQLLEALTKEFNIT